MAKRIGCGDYQYAVVENWPKVESRGAVADVCVDARGAGPGLRQRPQPA